MVSILSIMKKTVMKSLKIYLSLLIFAVGTTSCVAPPRPAHPRGSKPMPPGQAKKIYGTKSAKPFAPGQSK